MIEKVIITILAMLSPHSLLVVSAREGGGLLPSFQIMYHVRLNFKKSTFIGRDRKYGREGIHSLYTDNELRFFAFSQPCPLLGLYGQLKPKN